MATGQPQAVVDLEDFIGTWRDDRGHPIVVEQGRGNKRANKSLDVTLHRRRDQPQWLSIKPGSELGAFCCGKYNLDFQNSHTARLRWIGNPNTAVQGRVTIWERLDQPDRSNVNLPDKAYSASAPRLQNASAVHDSCGSSTRISDFCNDLVSSNQQVETEANTSMPEVLVDKLHQRILPLVTREPAVGNKIVELSPHAKLYRFLQQIVRCDKNQCRNLWYELDAKMRMELLRGHDLPEGHMSDSFLLSLIDPGSHIPLRDRSLTVHAEAAIGSTSGGSSASGSDQSSWFSNSCSRSRKWNANSNNSNGEGTMSHLESVSRKLSMVLRHDTKLPVRSDGFFKLVDVLALRRFRDINCTVDDVRQVVDGAHESGNRKQRFQVREEGDELLIRANQGYSRKDILAESAYRRLVLDDPNLPDPCVHGTYKGNWQSILERGLLAGGLLGHQGRNEIHFACEEPTAVGGTRKAISGMRHDCDVAIWIDLPKAMEDGLPFYISDNFVILTPGDEDGAIDSRYFLKVMDISSRPPRQIWPLREP